MKQAGPEFLTDVELNQEKASQTGEFSTEPTRLLQPSEQG